MRDFLNAILAFCGQSSLTDIEYNALTIEAAGYNQATYAALSTVLATRESVSSAQQRLTAFFTAKGVVPTDVLPKGKSNIFIGGVLN